MEFLLRGLESFLVPSTLLFTSFGVFAGIIIGVLPGLGPLLGLTLLTPMSMGMDPFAGMGLLLGVFVGGTCGGAISAILLRIPGTPIAAATLLDGYPMAQKGQAPLAVGLAISASAVGGMIGGVFLIFLSPALALVARQFGPPEFFALAVTGIVMIAIVSRGTTVKGFMVGLLGLLIGTMGMDPYITFMRFTFGLNHLTGGIKIVPLVVGVFAISEMFRQIEVGGLDLNPGIKAFRAPFFQSLKVVLKRWGNVLRSSATGSVVGAIPGTGTVIAAFLSYSFARGTSKHPEEYGTGTPDGVIATESSNNACVGGALVPTMALGIPGEPSSALLLAALLLLGFHPGPRLFSESPEMVGGIFLAYLFANFGLLIIGLLLTPFFVSILNLKKKYMVPGILLLSVIGVFGMENNVSDLWTMLVFGFVGYMLTRYDFPLAPIIIAFILGPIIESSFRRSLIMSASDYSIFFTRPVGTSILAINAILLVLTMLPTGTVKRIKRKFFG
jgi:putative tricarboxylic transport membrane protein